MDSRGHEATSQSVADPPLTPGRGNATGGVGRAVTRQTRSVET
jgi:hypothetical protein